MRSIFNDMRDVVFESTRSFSAEEFWQLVEEGERTGDVHRYELLNGRVVMSPPAGFPHGFTAAAIGHAIRAFVEERQLGLCFESSQGFRLPDGSVVEPDYSFVSNERWRACSPPEDGKFLSVVPDLLVEVLSTSTSSRDRGEKKALYEHAGVAEYWLIDTRAREVIIHVRQGGRFLEQPVRLSGESAESTVLPGLTIAVAKLFP